MIRSWPPRPVLGLLAFILAGSAPMIGAAPRKPAPLPVATSLPAPVKVTTVEGITEYRLANGLQVLLFQDPGRTDITVNITYRVGSLNESYGETGMAHLLEHMLFKGTSKHPNMPKEFIEHGARYNASTTTDCTHYYETLHVDEKGENIDWALALEADRMTNSILTQNVLWDKETQKGEMSVVRNEVENIENSPSAMLTLRVQGAAYAWHNYGKAVVGARSDVENVDIKHLQAFYHTYYQPDNATLMVTGKFDEATTLASINRNFGPILKPTRTLPKTYTQEPPQDGERLVTLRRTGDVQMTMAAYHIPAASAPDFAALEVLSVILGDDVFGRLHRALEKPGKATSTFATVQFRKEPGLLSVGAESPKGCKLNETTDLLLQTVEGATASPFTAEEVDRAKQSIQKMIDLALTDSAWLGLTLSNAIGLGDWRLYFLERDRIKTVTPVDVQRVAQTYLKPSNRTLGLFIPTPAPDRTVVPPPEDLAAMLRDYKGQPPVAAGAAFDASPTAIEARTQRFTTPAGVNVAMVPWKTRGGMVHALLQLHFGNEKSLWNRGAVGGLAASMLIRGTTLHTRTQIQDALDRCGASVSFFGNARGAGVAFDTTREHLTETMRWVQEILRSPSFPASEFEELKQARLGSLEKQRGEPMSLGFIAWSHHLNPYPQGHPYYSGTLEENIADLKAVTLEETKAFYQEFYGASNGELAVVGDFDPNEMHSAIQEWIGTWKSPAPYAHIPRSPRDPDPIDETIETPDKRSAIFYAAINMHIKDTDPEWPALVLGNSLLGGGFQSSRLAARIREKEGLSYNISVSLNTYSPMDDCSQWFAMATCAPQNAAKVEASFREEIARVLKEGFTPDEIAGAKANWVQNAQAFRGQTTQLTRKLTTLLEMGRTLDFDAQFDQKIQALTNEQILAALRKHLDSAKFCIVKAGDFKKSKQAPTQPAAGTVAK
jgi:zinc protease